MEISTVRVLPAMASRLMGLKIKQQLAATPGIEMVGEAFDAAQAVYQIQQERPHVVLCDDRMLDQPEFIALFALGARRVPFKVVVVAANAVMTQHHDAVPVETVVSIEISGEALLGRLRTILGMGRTRQAPPPVGMRDRFMVAQPNPLENTLPESISTTRLNSPANQVIRSLMAPPEVLTKPLDRSRTARRDEAVQARISAVLGGEHQHRDSLTGLPGTDDLSHTLGALPAANHPLAILVVNVTFPAGSTPTEAEFFAALRSATAVLRTNVRHSDLVFHLEDIAFALVLPGLDISTSARSLHRLRTALDRYRQPNERRPQTLNLAMGIGFWEPGIPPAHPLQQAWQAMLADRDDGTH